MRKEKVRIKRGRDAFMRGELATVISCQNVNALCKI
jgi:hypothetical protein